MALVEVVVSPRSVTLERMSLRQHEAFHNATYTWYRLAENHEVVRSLLFNGEYIDEIYVGVTNHSRCPLVTVQKRQSLTLG